MFNDTQRRWHVSEQELYAIIYCIEKWRPLLVNQRFGIHTDHKNLKSLLNKATNFKTGKLYRWATRIQDLSFDVHHIPGRENKFADYLSRHGLWIENVTEPKTLNCMDGRDIERTYCMLLECDILDIPRSRSFDLINKASTIQVPRSCAAHHQRKYAKNPFKFSLKENMCFDQKDEEDVDLYIKDTSNDNNRSNTAHRSPLPPVPSLEDVEPPQIDRTHRLFLSYQDDGTGFYRHCRVIDDADPISILIEFIKCRKNKRVHRDILVPFDAELKNKALPPTSSTQLAPQFDSKGTQSLGPRIVSAQPRRISVHNQDVPRIPSKRNSARILKKWINEKSKDLKLFHVPTEIETQIPKEEMKKIEDWNRFILSNKPYQDHWNERLLTPPTTPILNYYNPQKIGWQMMLEKQREDAMLFGIIDFLQTGNRKNITSLPSYWYGHIERGRFILDKQGLLRYVYGHKALIVVPASLKQSILKSFHEHIHGGRDNVKYNVLKDYWWPSMQKEIGKYTSACIGCQKVKSSTSKRLPRGRMKLFSATKPFDMISMDIVGPMPTDSNGNRYIVSIIDRFSRYVRFIPVKNIRTLDILQALDQWMSLFGPPRVILSDNGPQFISYMFKDFAKTHQIHLKYTTTYHPECNGMIERIHRWLKERLALIAYDGGLDLLNEDDWSPYLNVIAYAYNTSPNRMTKVAPHSIILGINPQQMRPFDSLKFDPRTPLDYMKWQSQRVAIIRNKAINSQRAYDLNRKRRYDRTSTSDKYEVGSTVMYNISSSRKGNKRKLQPNWVGPFEIIEVWNEGQSYKIRDKFLPDFVVKVHRKHLKPFNQEDPPIIAVLKVLNVPVSDESAIFRSTGNQENVDLRTLNCLDHIDRLNEVLMLELDQKVLVQSEHLRLHRLKGLALMDLIVIA